MKNTCLKFFKPFLFGLLAIGVSACGGGGGDSGPDEVACGGDAGNTCLAGEFCKYEDLSCGAATVAGPAKGVCRAIPLDCNAPQPTPTPDATPNPNAIVGPVCTCDRITFFNDCWASAAAQSPAAAGECP